VKFVSQLLAAQRARWPAMEAADIYKLFHQAALGPAHAVSQTDALSALGREVAALASAPPGAPATPPAEPISPDGRLARVHLRAWAAAALPWDVLADALARTAATWTPAPDKLARFCGCLGDLADAEPATVGVSRDVIVAFVEQRARDGWPAVRHSDTFRHAYAPAYRVIDLTQLPEPVRVSAA
jgi:hypothetical protein